MNGFKLLLEQTRYRLREISKKRKKESNETCSPALKKKAGINQLIILSGGLNQTFILSAIIQIELIPKFNFPPSLLSFQAFSCWLVLSERTWAAFQTRHRLKLSRNQKERVNAAN